MLLGGPPGAGKTLLARAVPSILPRMTFDESLLVTKIYSVAGQLPSDTPLIRHRPFRSNSMVSRYQKRISGPLLDRIDIRIEVPHIDAGSGAGRKTLR